MNELTERLSPSEVEELERFLDDEARLGIVGLEGLLVGVSSAPSLVVPSEWIPVALGHRPFATMEDAQRISGLLMRHYNHILDAIAAWGPAHLVPGSDDPEAQSEFCRGFIEAASLDPDLRDDTSEVSDLLVPIGVIAGVVPPSDLRMEPARFERWLELESIELAETIDILHEAWLARRRAEAAPSGTFERRGSKVGRNDPCPCGSGKKYKRCCRS